MSSKRTKSFKQTIRQNVGKRIEAEPKKYTNNDAEMNNKRFVTVDLGSSIVRVDRGEYFVAQEEIKDIVRDIFDVGIDLKEHSKLNLYNICNFCYDMMYEGKNSNEMLFKLC